VGKTLLLAQRNCRAKSFAQAYPEKEFFTEFPKQTAEEL
jgi:hypothetical protein